jgi:hypothetical protein
METIGRRGSNSFRDGDQAIPSRVSQNYITSMEPQVQPVQDADRKEDSTGHQKAPQALTKASKDVG